MRLLIRQTAAFAIALLASLALLGAAAALSQAALARTASVPASRIADLAGSFLLSSVLVALLAAGLYARTRGASLVMVALALASLAGGREMLRRPPAAQPPVTTGIETLVVPREIRPMAEPGVWMYAAEVGADRLRGVLVIAPAVSRPADLRLSYVAEARPGPDLAVGNWHLSPQPAALTLVAADPWIQSIAADLSALEQRVRGARQGGKAALTLAGVLLLFAGTGALTRRSRWPVLGWSAALLVARGALFALGPRGQALAADTLGAAAPFAPLASVLALALLLAAIDLLTPDSRVRRQRARLG